MFSECYILQALFPTYANTRRDAAKDETSLVNPQNMSVVAAYLNGDNSNCYFDSRYLLSFLISVYKMIASWVTSKVVDLVSQVTFVVIFSSPLL